MSENFKTSTKLQFAVSTIDSLKTFRGRIHFFKWNMIAVATGILITCGKTSKCICFTNLNLNHNQIKSSKWTPYRDKKLPENFIRPTKLQFAISTIDSLKTFQGRIHLIKCLFMVVALGFLKFPCKDRKENLVYKPLTI